MTCVHLQQLYQVCQENDLKFSASDLLNIVCKQCQKQEVCPSVLFEQYEEPADNLGNDEVVEQATKRDNQ